VSWLLLYLLLQSYVPEWPGVMCMQGVKRIGTGSLGAAGWLPALVATLEWTRPALVFLAGAAFVLHLRNRHDAHAAFTGRVLAALLLCGLLAAFDGAVELSYLFIPKQERFLAAGCCTVSSSVAGAAGAPPLALAAPEEAGPGLWLAFFATGLVAVAAVSAALLALRPGRLGLALAAAALSIPLGVAFLGAVAAPAFLRVPHHACVSCAIARAPESLVAIALYALAACAVGWACVARWLGRAPAHACTPLLRFARFGYLASLAMVAVRLAFP